jgi:O-acetyl-ADP-ribose deacetylase (regulator of RNase III)
MQQILTIIQDDITTLSVDAIVNAANTSLFGGSGVCGAIFDAAGYDEMTKASKAIGSCAPGEAVLTPGFKLPAKWVIHTVGPVYGQNNGKDREILYNCYYSSLALADDNSLTSIAFPSISTGIYGYPKAEAATTAIEAIQDYFSDHSQSTIKSAILVAYSRDDLDILNKAMDK